MVFDAEAETLLDVVNLTLDEAELKKLTTPVQRDAILRREMVGVCLSYSP